MLKWLRPVATQPCRDRAAGVHVHGPRPKLASLARTLGFAAECHPDPIDAIDRAFGTGAHTVCVAGSIFLLGDVLGERPPRVDLGDPGDLRCADLAAHLCRGRTP